MKNFSFTWFLLLILTGCGATDDIPTPTAEKRAPLNAHRVSLSSAMQSAETLFDVIDEKIPTRSFRTVGDIRYAVAPQTRTTSDRNIDTLAYIVNYADKRGFAILGADDRMAPILAIAPEGSFDLADTAINEPLAEWVRNALSEKAIRSGLRTNCRSSIDTLIPPRDYPRYLDTTLYVRPWLNPYVSSWSQNANFNALCPSNLGYIQPVGCSPLAATQVMSFYECPTRYAQQSIDWNLIKNYPVHSAGVNCPSILAWFLWQVGNAFNTAYGVPYSGISTTSTSDIVSGMARMNYAPITAEHSYSASPNTATQLLRNGPLMVYAQEMAGSSQGSNLLHTWVADGYLSYTEQWELIDNPDHLLCYSLIHFVWGWGGAENAFFSIGNGASVNTDQFHHYSDEDPGTFLDDTEYFINLKYFSQFHPLY